MKPSMKPLPLVPTVVLMAILWIALFCAALLPQKANAAPNVFQIPMSPQSQQSSLMAPGPSYTDAIVLVANVSQTQAVPAGAKWLVFSGNCDFYAKLGASASVPGATTTDGSAAQLNPTAWWLYSSPTQITVIAAGACIVTLSFYN